MPPYIPTDNPQCVGQLNITSLYAVGHEPQLKKFGQAIESLSKLTVKRPQSPRFFDTSMKY
jgi:hypothetical protein